MKKKINTLSNKVSLSLQYQRSVRVDIDLGREDALDNFICHNTSSNVLESMATQIIKSNQRAYTWTGPFGGGKSSLALTFASLLSNKDTIRQKARNKFSDNLITLLDQAFPVTKKGWITIPVVGKKSSFIKEIIKSINTLLNHKEILDESLEADVLIKTLLSYAENHNNDGVLLIIDELGKFLEYSAFENNNDDIHFFQDIAEAAARSQGKLIIVGILHQSFRNYANKLEDEKQEEWSKIQGRFSDIPLVVKTDEVVNLIGNAITTNVEHKNTINTCIAVADSIHRNRPSMNDELPTKLDLCWPLHPIMSILLGPISRKQYGQNERSIFTFLSSFEPYGFQHFLQNMPFGETNWYLPENYWAYLKANLEVAIQSSLDSHRWAQAVEAVERTEARVKTSDDIRVSLIKSIAIINLFRNGTGLIAEKEILCSLYPELSVNEIDKALADLSLWRVAVYRKHLNSWVIFEGSDFDVDDAIRKAKTTFEKIDIKELAKLTELHPIIAKRHYHRTGSLRWMDILLLSEDETLDSFSNGIASQTNAFGHFILTIPSNGTNIEKLEKELISHYKKYSENKSIIVGVAPNFEKILALSEDLLSLNYVRQTFDGVLESDSVARREILSRIDVIKLKIEEEINTALVLVHWIVEGNKPKQLNMHITASKLADKLYKNTPIIRSELINRSKISPSIAKARKDLMYLLLSNSHEENLSLTGYPAERGIYDIVLKSTGLHKKNSQGEWVLANPQKESSLFALWKETNQLFSQENELIKVSSIYQLWDDIPFGLQDGIKPLLFLIYYLTNQDYLSIYKHGVFLPSINHVDIDELLQDEKIFSLRKVIIDQDKLELLQGISDILNKFNKSIKQIDPLSAARGLVGIIFKLPQWTLKTQLLSKETTKVRDLLLKASDPYKILFIDLMHELGHDGISSNYLEQLLKSIDELVNAYDNNLKKINQFITKELGGTKSNLAERCKGVKAVSQDLRFNAFIDRIKVYSDSKANLESLLSLTVNKPATTWLDSDLNNAQLQLMQWITKFKQYETFASIKGRKPTRDVYAVIVGTGNKAQTRMVEFAVSEEERNLAQKEVSAILEKLLKEGHSPEALLAAFTETGINKLEGKN
ncbi:hypothetical protein [Gilliamella apis]|uniref:hypothetical protein n=1 Tax=Gilliamella apis TaxID=1970738 RepID=UPI000A34CA2F|nr:hypothetical protein [Gilliamella apis]OTQ62442.1 hypothetical protein B6C98_02595 [Gilliamella apis]OTQ65162.1 hypothetical protein B6D09_03390 [Gilliamella apis]OTQ67390.1 hypothetical protein B6C89_04490 [Gilliamella apis]OTQ69799.1 hypothetical protein B6D10_02515 [Gilliamella apis]